MAVARSVLAGPEHEREERLQKMMALHPTSLAEVSGEVLDRVKSEHAEDIQTLKVWLASQVPAESVHLPASGQTVDSSTAATLSDDDLLRVLLAVRFNAHYRSVFAVGCAHTYTLQHCSSTINLHQPASAHHWMCASRLDPGTVCMQRLVHCLRDVQPPVQSQLYQAGHLCWIRGASSEGHWCRGGGVHLLPQPTSPECGPPSSSAAGSALLRACVHCVRHNWQLSCRDGGAQ